MSNKIYEEWRAKQLNKHREYCPCPRCHNTGFIEYTDIAGDDYIFFCDCLIGYQEEKGYKDAYWRIVDREGEE